MEKRVAVAVTLLMVFSGIVMDYEIIDATTNYIVGDEFGWTSEVSMEVWPGGKQFYAGDILEFKYDSQEYDVRVVKKVESEQCSVPDSAPAFDSGDDKLALQFGANYFTTSRSEDCQLGMKLAINATSRPPALERFILRR